MSSSNATTIPFKETSANPVPPSWLVSRRMDLLVIVAGGLAWSAIFYASAALGWGFILLATFFAVTLDFPHVLQTYLRVLSDKQERKLFGNELSWSFFIIALIVGYLSFNGAYACLLMIWIYWQPFHVIKQHLGVVSLYCARDGYRGNISLAKVVLVLSCLMPILYRMAHQGFVFGHFAVGGAELPFSGMRVPTPPVPDAMVEVGFILLGVAAAKLLWEQWQRHRAGEKTLPLSASTNIALAAISYGFAYIFVDQLFAAILIAASVHSLQYHTICWAYRKNKEKLGGASQITIPSLKTAANFTRKYAVQWAVLISLGAICASLELVARGVLPLTIVLHHFYMDGIIWRKIKPAGQDSPVVGLDVLLPVKTKPAPAT